MFKTEHIDGQPFFILSAGNRERILTNAEAISHAHAVLNTRAIDRDAQQRRADNIIQRIQSAVMAGESTASLREDLVDIRAMQAEAETDIYGAAAAISSVRKAMVQHHAAALDKALAESTQAITITFDAAAFQLLEITQ